MRLQPTRGIRLPAQATIGMCLISCLLSCHSISHVNGRQMHVTPIHRSALGSESSGWNRTPAATASAAGGERRLPPVGHYPPPELYSGCCDDCNSETANWHNWDQPCTILTSWPDFYRAITIANHWRVALSWSSPQDAVRIARSGVDGLALIAELLMDTVELRSTYASREQAREAAVRRLHQTEPLAQSSWLATGSIFAHAASILATSPACRTHFSSQRDGMLQASIRIVSTLHESLSNSRRAASPHSLENPDMNAYLDLLLREAQVNQSSISSTTPATLPTTPVSQTNTNNQLRPTPQSQTYTRILAACRETPSLSVTSFFNLLISPEARP